MASVVYEAIEKTFGKTQVVKGVSLEIRDGEFVALLGPSGCGKTTCLRMLAGLEEPTAGRILIDGEDVTYKRPRDRDISMVFQNYALYPHMTVRKNIEMGLKYRDVPKAEHSLRIDEVVKLLDIDQLLDRMPAELSGGQRQRVALGRAIVRRPKALLMDEPLSNLDAALRAKMRVDLKLLQKRVNTTTLYVTHDQREAMTMADRIAVMSEGRVMQFDTPDRVFGTPANRFVAQFVGSPGVNILPATYLPAAGGASLMAGSLVLPLSEHAPAVFRTARLEIGIRPNFLRLNAAPGMICGSGRIVATEPFGTETNLHVALGDQVVVLVVEPRQAPPVGEVIVVSCAPSDVYVFDAGDGRLLSHGL
jgi:multiple sugar transport system ATP-binding protein